MGGASFVPSTLSRGSTPQDIVFFLRLAVATEGKSGMDLVLVPRPHGVGALVSPDPSIDHRLLVSGVRKTTSHRNTKSALRRVVHLKKSGTN